MGLGNCENNMMLNGIRTEVNSVQDYGEAPSYCGTNELYERVGTNYNADDLADKIPAVLKKMEKKLGVLYH